MIAQLALATGAGSVAVFAVSSEGWRTAWGVVGAIYAITFLVDIARNTVGLSKPSVAASVPRRASKGGPRVFRVFVSSTFLDMEGERDHLVHFVFPRLRRLCESRGITWGAIDLRWGITPEQQAHGQVLPICFREIERSQGCFLGLLGDRYGSVPEAVPDELLLREPWLRNYENRSVTELEILFALMREPRVAKRSLMLLRGRGSETATDDGESAEAARRLRELRRLVESAATAVVPYGTVAEMGETVLAFLTTEIEHEFPDGPHPDWLTAETARHASFAAAHVPDATNEGFDSSVHVWSKEVGAELDRFLSNNGNRRLALQGPVGCGKTALIANWLERVPARFHVAAHYVGASPSNAGASALVRHLIADLQHCAGQPPGNPLPEEDLASALVEAMRQAAEKAQVLVVIDGLDQLVVGHGPVDLSWLPLALPPRVWLVVSSRPGPVLELLKQRGWSTQRVQGLERAERSALLTGLLAAEGRAVTSGVLRGIVACPLAESPLYLTMLWDAMKACGSEAQMLALVERVSAATNPQQFFTIVLEHLERIFDTVRPCLVADTFCLLGAARSGLSEDELLRLLGQAESPLPAAHLVPLLAAVARLVRGRGPRLALGSGSLRDVVDRRWLSDSARMASARERILRLFERDSDERRKLEELPPQLIDRGDWDEAADLLSTPGAVELLQASDGSYEAPLARYWKLIERGSAMRASQVFRSLLEQPELNPAAALSVCSLVAVLGDRSAAAAGLERLLDSTAGQVGPALRARVLSLLAATVVASHPERASALLMESESVYRSGGSQAELAECLASRAALAANRGDLPGAEELFRHSERAAADAGDRVRRDAALRGRANVLARLKRQHEALALVDEGIAGARHSGNPFALRKFLVARALVLVSDQHYDEAQRALEEAHALALDAGDIRGQAETLGNLASNAKARGQLRLAAEQYREQGRLCRELGHDHALAVCLWSLAVLSFEQGDLGRALSLHRSNEDLCRRIDDRSRLQQVLAAEAEIMLQTEAREAAAPVLAEALALARSLASPPRERSVELLIATSAYRAGDLPRAFEHSRRGLDLCDASTGSVERLEHIRLGGLIAASAGHSEISLDLHQLEERICREAHAYDAAASALASQAALLRYRLQREEEGKQKAREACALAVAHGHTRLAQELASLL